MAVDLNVDMGDLMKKLMNKNGKGQSVANVSAAGGGSAMEKIMFYKYIILAGFVVMLCAVYFFLNIYASATKENMEKEAKLTELLKKKEELVQLKQRADTIKNTLSKSKERYLEELSHFGNSEDLGELYQSVSKLATKYNLIVLNIKEVEPPKVTPKKGKDGKEIVEPKKLVSAKEIKVDVELKGAYNEYMLFKEDLSIAEMLLNVNTENIKVGKSTIDKNLIYAKLNLSTYAIDKTSFQEVMPANE